MLQFIEHIMMHKLTKIKYIYGLKASIYDNKGQDAFQPRLIIRWDKITGVSPE